ncbi:AMP-binding enzyme [Dictyocaulus viviparus]|uniref:AMP-binding enzyme n=1 Tax=Dictyocaulus viviparus TaxID=29172 RepID=A0A0D8Y594_DICVI|nr:AMP-binding enzyme [Dictyocaulus viviparus]
MEKLETTIPHVIPRDLPPWRECLRDSFNDIRIEMNDTLLLPFSSGTSGKPRCVILTHRNYSSATEILKRALFNELVSNSRRRTVAVLPFYHASGFWALLYSLLDGCHTVIMESFHPISMLEIIQKYEIDTLNVVPSILTFLCRIDIDRFDVSSLSTVLCGSSPLGKELVSLFLKKFPNVQNLIQGYGMTEIVVLSHITPFGIMEEKHYGSCGKLLPGFEAVLMDENGLIVSGPNRPGELYLKSPTVMRGYLNSEDDDQQQPFDSDGWFRTGEDVILSLPYVKEVGVVGVDDAEHGQIPKAFVVLQHDVDEQIAMTTKLSPIKYLRGGIEIVNELPKTKSGKVKRNELRKIFH